MCFITDQSASSDKDLVFLNPDISTVMWHSSCSHPPQILTGLQSACVCVEMAPPVGEMLKQQHHGKISWWRKNRGERELKNLVCIKQWEGR